MFRPTPVFPLLDLPIELFFQITLYLDSHSLTNLTRATLFYRALKETIITAITAETGKDSHINWAATYGYSSAVEFFLNSGMDVNGIPEGGWTPLNIHYSPMGVSAVRSDAWAPLHVATHHGHKAVVKQLLEKGAAIEARTNFGSSLHIAACCGHTDIVELLLDHGADIHAMSDGEWGDTTLHRAAGGGYTDVVVLLLSRGAGLNTLSRTIDNIGATPLHHAVHHQKVQMVRLLLQQGADQTVVGFSGLSALHTCIFHHWAYDLWRPGGGGKLGRPVRYDPGLPIVKLLLEYGADTCFLNGFNASPLHLAVMVGFYEMVRVILCSSRHSLDLQEEHRGFTALMWAAINKRTNIVRLLLAAGAGIKKEDNFGSTALQIAENNDREGIACLIRDREAADLVSGIQVEDIKDQRFDIKGYGKGDWFTRDIYLPVLLMMGEWGSVLRIPEDYFR